MCFLFTALSRWSEPRLGSGLRGGKYQLGLKAVSKKGRLPRGQGRPGEGASPGNCDDQTSTRYSRSGTHFLSPPLLPFPIPQWTHHSIWPIRGQDIIIMTNKKLLILSPPSSLMTRTGLGRILPYFPRLQAGSCGVICGQRRGPGHRTQPGVIPGLWLVRTHPSHQHHLAAIFTEDSFGKQTTDNCLLCDAGSEWWGRFCKRISANTICPAPVWCFKSAYTLNSALS